MKRSEAVLKASISLNSCTELNKTQFFPLSIVKTISVDLM